MNKTLMDGDGVQLAPTAPTAPTPPTAPQTPTDGIVTITVYAMTYDRQKLIHCAAGLRFSD
jgi:hypothetical protein